MDSSDSESFQRLALPVPPIDINFDPNKAPETGEQYLQHVLYERTKKCADVVRVPLPPNKKKSACKRIEKVFQNDDGNVPDSQKQSTVEWQEIQLANFSNLRETIASMRRRKLPSTEEQDADGDGESDDRLPEITEKDEWETFCRENQPLLTIVTSIRSHEISVLLEYLQLWLQGATNEEINTTKAWIMMWIYACMAYVFVPLEPNVCSVLREIAKTCRKLRSSTHEVEQNLSYGLLICIISTYFRQLDLSDTINTEFQ